MPETLRPAFVLLIFFNFIWLFSFLLRVFLLDIQVLSILFLWKILWMGRELIGLGYQRNQ